MEYLPAEINCQIFNNLTDPNDIIQLAEVNRDLGRLARECVTTLAWNDSDGAIGYKTIALFPNVRVVKPSIYIYDRRELMLLADTKITSADIIINASIFNGKYQSLDLAQAEINLITNWYLRRMSHPPYQNKDFKFSYPTKYYYIRIQDGSFDVKLEINSIDFYIRLLRAIDETDGLTQISSVGLSKKFLMAGRLNFPKLETFLVNSIYDDIYPYLRYTNINKVKLSTSITWTEKDIKTLAHNFCSLLSQYGKLGITLEKDVSLEIPITPKCIEQLLTVYPNVHKVGIYLSDDSEFENVNRLSDEGVSIILYTSIYRSSLAKYLHSPWLQYVYLDE